jgi:hypothetical protein
MSTNTDKFPTAVARIRSEFKSYGICGKQRESGAGFLRLFRFLLLIFIVIPQTAPYSLIILSSTLYNLVTDSVIKYKLKS